MKDFIKVSTFKFTDKVGVERNVTMALVIEPLVSAMVAESVLEVLFTGDTTMVDITKKISIGLAIHNPLDTYDATIGETIAIGKAKKNKTSVLKYYTDANYVSDTLIQALMEDVRADFLKNPDKYFVISENSALETKKAVEDAKLTVTKPTKKSSKK